MNWLTWMNSNVPVIGPSVLEFGVGFDLDVSGLCKFQGTFRSEFEGGVLGWVDGRVESATLLWRLFVCGKVVIGPLKVHVGHEKYGARCCLGTVEG